ncbi:hypothetical protein QR680_005596 [Steinernema hermaphroditum]|uniref:ZP domain-containing protein n=1 Tax=Steinernema hermaphroditum TaxID=289476 RepID=A0AA39HUV1_9BILA|nr:hypothetical protein QR680_005596 [Steinernema hermaphroditum]
MISQSIVFWNMFSIPALLLHSSFLLPSVASANCSLPRPSDLILVNQFVSKPRRTFSTKGRISHVLSAKSQLEGFDLFYPLEGRFLSAPSKECISECTVKINALRLMNNSFESYVMVREGEEWRFPEYEMAPSIGSFFCASAQGRCSASMPLFEFTSDAFEDHYANTDYELSESSYTLEANGRPLCFIWDVSNEDSPTRSTESSLPRADSEEAVDAAEPTWSAWKTTVVVATLLGALLIVSLVAFISICCFHASFCKASRRPTVDPYPRGALSPPQTPPRPIETVQKESIFISTFPSAPGASSTPTNQKHNGKDLRS